MNVQKYRALLKTSQLLVVKVGTSSLAFNTRRLNFQWMTRLAHVLSTIRREGKHVILVSSGAVGVGAGRLGILKRPATLSDKQALAALGQAELIKIYQRIFRDYDQLVAQVLLTRDGMEDPVRRTNARNTLKTLLSMEVIPIINENDTVSTREMEFGDNDQLSARVCEITGADLLVLLSDIDGLYSADPRRNHMARLIPVVYDVSEEVEAAAGSAGTDVGTGGMATKLEAARICRLAGSHMVIANGKDPAVIREILEGKEVGTLFIAQPIHTIK
ncbi:MAG TPA: glutamate 5-kinase [Bacteroidetes bacterium]|nr:glutamate 5-kinase [Bacteroidota bacterium]